MTNKKKYISIIKRVIHILLPIVILFVIFRKVDFDTLLLSLKRANTFLIILGICLRPLQIVAGAFRWRILNQIYYKQKLSGSYMAYHYWAGLTVGYFTPSNLGWDAYKIMIVGRKLKAYLGGLFVIISEKIVSVISVIILLLVTFPFITQMLPAEYGKQWLQYYFYGIVMLVVFILIFIILYNTKRTELNNLANKIWNKIFNKFISIIRNIKIKQAITSEYEKSPSILSVIHQPKQFTLVLLASVFIFVIAALCSQFMFEGLHYEINFVINLFAAPVFFILFLIPISFGSIGVREGAFILLYGLFGVPMEIALLLSFLNLISLFLNNIIGAIIMFIKGVNKEV